MKKDHRSIGQIYRDMNNGSAGALDDTASLSALEIQMRTVEAKLDEVLEYGTTQAKVQYAKDTPGQTPGVEQEPTQKPKSGLAVDGVPKAGGEMNKPDAKLQMDKTLPEENEIEENNLVRDLDPVGQADADIDNDGDVDKSDKYLKNRRKKIKKAINKEGYKRTTDIDVEQGERDLKKAKLDKKIADVKEAKNCGCGEDPCKTYGKGGTKEMEEQAQLDEYGALMAKKGMCPMCSKKDGKEVLMSSCGCQNEEVEFDEAMSVTLRKSKSQPGTFKVHSVGDKMKAHGGIKPGERVRDHEIDGLHDSRIKVKYHKEGFQVPQFSKFVTERNTNVKDHPIKIKATVGKAKPIAGHPDYKANPISKPMGTKLESVSQMDEAGRWDNTSSGKRYRSMTPEQKKRIAQKNRVMKQAKSVYAGKLNREEYVGVLEDYSEEDAKYMFEAMSPAERKVAAGKIFRMHQAKMANKQSDNAAKKAAKRDSASYKTSDDSHLDAKPSAPKPKGKRGISDAPHIVGQLRGVVDTKGNHKGVQFKDGSTHKVSVDHASSWLKKHDSSKPAQKLSMYKHHDSHKAFKAGMSEGNLQELSPELIKKVAHQRNVNVSMAGSKADYDRRDPDYQKAAQKQHRNQTLRFSAGAKAANKIGKALAARMKKESNDSMDRMADTYNDHADNKHPKVQSHIKKAKKAYDSGDHEGFYSHTQNAADAARTHKEGYKQDFKRKEIGHELGNEVNRKTSKPKMSNAWLKSGGDKKVVTNPLRKEETVSELKIDTMNKYKSAAKADIQTGENARHKGYPEKEIDSRQGKRDKGIATANKRIAKKQVKMAKGIAFDKRYKGGNMTGASKAINKIKPGLSDHPKVSKALQRANEAREFNKELFGQNEAIERRADRKTIIATDPATGRKVVKVAPKKEIDIGKGKMA